MFLEFTFNFSFCTFLGVQKKGKGIWRNKHVIKLKIVSCDEIAVISLVQPSFHLKRIEELSSSRHQKILRISKYLEKKKQKSI